MGLLNLDFQGYRRTCAYLAPDDWFEHWGTLPLIVGLHGGNSNAADFMDITEVGALLQGEFNDPPEPQKFIAVFPEGLSARSFSVGSWSAGHMGRESATFGVDDVGFCLACVEAVNNLFFSRYIELVYGIPAFNDLNPIAGPIQVPVGPPPGPIPVGPDGEVPRLPLTFYEHAKTMLIGHSQGGQMAYRLAIEGKLRPNGIVFTMVGVSAATCGGLPFTDINGQPNSMLADDGETWWFPGPNDFDHNLMHFHGDADTSVSFRGEVAPGNMEEVDKRVGPGKSVFRWDYAPGPELEIDSTGLPLSSKAEGTALAPWVAALPGVASVTPERALDGNALLWAWRAFGGRIVRYYLLLGGQHRWPQRGSPFGSATGVIWRKLQELP